MASNIKLDNMIVSLLTTCGLMDVANVVPAQSVGKTSKFLRMKSEKKRGDKTPIYSQWEMMCWHFAIEFCKFQLKRRKSRPPFQLRVSGIFNNLIDDEAGRRKKKKTSKRIQFNR